MNKKHPIIRTIILLAFLFLLSPGYTRASSIGSYAFSWEYTYLIGKLTVAGDCIKISYSPAPNPSDKYGGVFQLTKSASDITSSGLKDGDFVYITGTPNTEKQMSTCAPYVYNVTTIVPASEYPYAKPTSKSIYTTPQPSVMTKPLMPVETSKTQISDGMPSTQTIMQTLQSSKPDVSFKIDEEPKAVDCTTLTDTKQVPDLLSDSCSGEQYYEVQTTQRRKVFNIIPISVPVQYVINPATNTIIEETKPWYATVFSLFIK